MEKIKVMLRLRPFTDAELSKNPGAGWVIDKEVDWISSKDSSLHHHPFTFDKIFTEEKSNREVYMDSCQKIIENSMEGIDTTIFVYG